jgi:sugar lactone lactonase YvrE
MLLTALACAACSGEDGKSGSMGAPGADGETGMSGAAGPAGQMGAAGPAGVAGPAGEAGADGPAGAELPTAVDRIDLPTSAFFPESLTAAKDGTLFVGSLGGQGIVRIAAGTGAAETFVAKGVVKNIAGVMVDDAGGLLYACETDLSANPYTTGVRSFDLATGKPKQSYPLAKAGVCNDMTFDNRGNLFATDSFGRVYELPKGGKELTLWSDDALLAPTSAGGFGADGIVFDGKSNLYVNAFSDSRLLRIAIDKDGKAGAVTSIVVTPALSYPDGMRVIDENTLLVVEGAGRLSKLVISEATATASVLVNRLDAPTSVVTVGGQNWISEGQLGVFLGQVAGPPALPFVVRRFQD